jgi:hypothetical protein
MIRLPLRRTPTIERPLAAEERRLVAEARRRVSREVAQLSALQRDLQRAQDRCRRAIEEVERRRRLAEGGPIVGAYNGNGVASTEPDRPTERGELVRLRSAGYADLRALGLSVTQANRVLDYVRTAPRTVADLCRVSWLPHDVRAELAQRLSD